MPAAQQEYDAIMSINTEIENISVQENPYTSLTKEVNEGLTFLMLNCLVLSVALIVQCPLYVKFF